MHFQVRNEITALTWLVVETATTSHHTTSTYAVGSFKERRSPLGSSPALPPVLPPGNRTTASPRPKTPSRFSLTGSPSQARGTVEPQSTRLPGPPRRAQAFTLLNTSTIWQKRSASYHQFRHPLHLPYQAHTRTRKLTYLAFQGEINVDQAHRGYDITMDGTGKTWYNPF